jgi:hypothetical protein
VTRLAAPLAVALALTAAHAVPARADDDTIVTPEKREANALYKEGVRLFKAHDYASALDLFQRAWQTFPAARVEYSLATTLKQMGRTVEAANWYQRFIDDPGAEPQLVADARTVLTLLDTTVGRVEVSTDGAMAEVQIGDGPWQETRGHMVARVAAGSVIVRGRRQGFVAEATAQLAAGGEQAITLRWTDAKPPPPHDEPKRVPPPSHVTTPPTAATTTTVTASVAPSPTPGRGRRIAAVASAGAGVALVGAALLFQHASSVHADQEVSLSQENAPADAVRAEYDRSLRDHDLALAGGGVAALAIAAGAYLWITAPRAHVQLTPLADDHSVGLLFTGRF